MFWNKCVIYYAVFLDEEGENVYVPIFANKIGSMYKKLSDYEESYWDSLQVSFTGDTVQWWISVIYIKFLR